MHFSMDFFIKFSFTDSTWNLGDLDEKNPGKSGLIIFNVLKAGWVQLVIVLGDLINSEHW